MRFSIAVSLCSTVALVNARATKHLESQYLDGLLQVVEDNGGHVISSYLANIPELGRVWHRLEDGQPYTLLMPSDNAFKWDRKWLAKNATAAAEKFDYYIVQGKIDVGTFPQPPQKSHLKTLYKVPELGLSADGSVATQVLAFSNNNGTLQVEQAGGSTPIVGNATYQNLDVLMIDNFLHIPKDLTTELLRENRTIAQRFLQTSIQTSLTTTETFDVYIGNQPNLTFFIPSEEAYSSYGSMSAMSEFNEQQVVNVISNMIGMGASFETDLRAGKALQSAADLPFVFSSDSEGLKVTIGDETAKVIKSDILVENGVVHIIDKVILNTHSSDNHDTSRNLSIAVLNPVAPYLSTGNSSPIHLPSYLVTLTALAMTWIL